MNYSEMNEKSFSNPFNLQDCFPFPLVNVNTDSVKEVTKPLWPHPCKNWNQKSCDDGLHIVLLKWWESSLVQVSPPCTLYSNWTESYCLQVHWMKWSNPDVYWHAPNPTLYLNPLPCCWTDSLLEWNFFKNELMVIKITTLNFCIYPN